MQNGSDGINLIGQRKKWILEQKITDSIRIFRIFEEISLHSCVLPFTKEEENKSKVSWGAFFIEEFPFLFISLVCKKNDKIFNEKRNKLRWKSKICENPDRNARIWKV